MTFCSFLDLAFGLMIQIPLPVLTDLSRTELCLNLIKPFSLILPLVCFGECVSCLSEPCSHDSLCVCVNIFASVKHFGQLMLFLNMLCK